MNDEDMLSSVIDPLILEIFLFHNNYKDRILISELKERAMTVKVPGIDENSFFVKVSDVEDILNTKFKKDLSDFDSTPYQSLNQSVTSIYFIDSMIRSFSKMKYFRINVSDSEVYTRRSNDVISFEYRIMHSLIDLTEICTPEVLDRAIHVLKDAKLISNSSFDKSPYFETSAREIMLALRNYQLTLDSESEEFEFVQSLQTLFGSKLEKDNSVVLVIFGN